MTNSVNGARLDLMQTELRLASGEGRSPLDLGACTRSNLSGERVSIERI
jgi:hypothetical protein